MPNPIIDLPGEVWKPVVGYEGFYEVSNMGRVKSLARAYAPPEQREALRLASYCRKIARDVE